MTVLGALTRRESRAVQATAWGDWGDSGQTWSGSTVTTSSALQLLTVYGSTRFICDGVSTLPVDVFTRRPDGAAEEVEPPGWVLQPTPDLDFVSWATQVLSSALLAGNGWCWQSYGPTGLSSLTPLDPSTVKVTRDPGKRRVVRINGVEVDARNLLHIPAMMFAGSEVGLAPVECARQTIGVGLAAQEYSARFFAQDATPGGVIEVPGEMPPDKAAEMARAWARKHSGKSKAGLPGVLQGGATWRPTAVTNEQAQFLETQKFTAGQIAAQMFLIDPSELGLPVEGGSLTYTNIESRAIRKLQVTFLPWIIRLERALTSLLPPGQFLKLNVNGLLRGDMKSRFEAYGIGITHEFMVPNEPRAFEDWPPLPGGDKVVAKPVTAATRGVHRDVHGRILEVDR